MKLQLYDKSKIDFEHLQFDRDALKKLILPLMLEQLLNTFMGMMDTVMVSRAGSAAISAVSLVDAINVLFIQMFEALSAGGVIVCSFYIGRKDRKRANEAAEQVLLSNTFLALLITVICVSLRRPMLALVFGKVEADVMRNSITYFLITGLSYPFVAIMSCGAAFYRAGGESRFPMTVSVLCNILNIIGNAILIFGFQMGVAGAAISTLISRIVNALVLMIFLRRDRQEIVVRHYLVRPDWRTIRNVLSIGIPNGVENGMFQFGKLVIQSSVSLLGTTAIAAQAMTILLESLNGITAIGIGIGMMTVVGQCIGAGKPEEAKYYICRLTGLAEIVVCISCAVVFALTKPITLLGGMEPAAADMCFRMMILISIWKPIVWTLSFIPAYGLRAAGDVRFSMTVSSLTMWLCRVVLATLLIRVFHFGPVAVWIGMGCDWSIRAVIFTVRFLHGKWLKKGIVREPQRNY